MAITVKEVWLITPTGDRVKRYGLFSDLTANFFPFHYDTQETAQARADKIITTIGRLWWAEQSNFWCEYPLAIG